MRTVPVVLLLLVFAALLPSTANASVASLAAACADDDGIRFCDDGVPDAGGRMPNPGGLKAIEVPAAYAGFEGLPPRDDARAVTVPGNSGGNVAIDGDLSLPAGPPPASGYPLVVFMHGCCAGNKTDWESDTIYNPNERWHHSSRWFAQRGYAVLNYTARGFVTTTPTGDKGSTGETQIDHRSFEINDFQSLAGQLADGLPAGMRIDPQRIIPIGGSYGGGWAWLAMTDPRWRSPAGKDMKLAAVVTKYGWTDLANSLFPTGLLKRSFTAVLFQSGALGTPNANGSRHATFPAEITQTAACLNASDPSQLPPPCSDVVGRVTRSFVEERSAFHQNQFFDRLRSDPSLATPVFVAGTFSDQLFTMVESTRMVDRLQSIVPGYPIQQYYGDYLHAAQSKGKEWSDLCGADRHVCNEADGARADTNEPPASRTAIGINSRISAFVDHFVRPATNPSAPRPAFDATGSLYVCKTNASERTPFDQPGERFTAPSFRALAPNGLTAAFTGAQTTTSTVAQNEHATQADPVFNAATNGNSCPNTTSRPGAGVAAYQTEALPSPRTMLGMGDVTYRYSGQSPDPETLQLNTRLYDVAPNGRATLVDRGVQRLNKTAGEISYQLHGQGWRFERGHAIRIEATQDDDPYIRRSTTPSSLEVSSARIRLPIRERATALRQGAVGRPGPPASGGRPGSGSGSERRRCRAAVLDRARVRPLRRGLRIVLPRRARRVSVTIFQQSVGRRIVGNRTIAKFRGRRRSFTWNGRATRSGRRSTDGLWFVRLRRGRDERRFAFVRRGGRFQVRRRFSRSPGCGLVPFFKLSASVFGGRFNRPLGIAFRLTGRANVTVLVRQRGRTLRTFRRRGVRRGRTVRLRMPSERVRRGDVRIVLRARAEGRTVTRTLVARRL